MLRVRPGEYGEDQLQGYYEILLKDKGMLFIHGEFGLNNLLDLGAICMAVSYLDPVTPITLIVASPGGVVQPLMNFLDILQSIPNPVRTITQFAYSAAAYVSIYGTVGERYMFPSAKLMLHMPWGGVVGTAEDARVHAEEMGKITTRLTEILIERGARKSAEELRRDIGRADFYLNPKEAIEYGIMDKVLTPEVYRELMHDSRCA